MSEQQIDVSRLPLTAQRAVQRLVSFLRLKTSGPKQHGRLEVVVTDGKIRNVNQTDTIAPEEIECSRAEHTAAKGDRGRLLA